MAATQQYTASLAELDSSDAPRAALDSSDNPLQSLVTTLTPLPTRHQSLDQPRPHSTPADPTSPSSPGSTKVVYPSTDSNNTSIRCGSKDTLAALDRRGSGEVTVEDIRAGVHQMRLVRRFTVFLVVLVFVLLAGMCCSTFFAVKWAAEMHVRHGSLQDVDGKGISTLQRFETMNDVHIAVERRLSPGIDMTAATGVSALALTTASFQNVRDAYAGGKVAWVVDMPDATVRTVHIQGMDDSRAWGACGTCKGNVRWQIICSSELGAECSIEWKESAMRRLQPAKDEVSPPMMQGLLARAGHGAQAEARKLGAMERSLQTKCQTL